MTGHPDPTPQARDLVDMRLLEAVGTGGCAICAVRARAERGILDTIISERVLDLGFRADLERKEGFCRRHVTELLSTDRREGGGSLGASILFAAILDRRTTGLAEAVGGGRGARSRLKAARSRPPCVACAQGATAVQTALVRFTERAADDDWAAMLVAAPFCLDDFLALWSVGTSSPHFEPIARAQLVRFEALRARLEGYAHHSSHDRRHLLTDDERSAADEASRALGGDRYGGGG